jgi:hypothetical protein
VVGTECRERLGRLVEVVAGVDVNLESELFASLTNRQRDQLRELLMTVRDHVNPSAHVQPLTARGSFRNTGPVEGHSAYARSVEVDDRFLARIRTDARDYLEGRMEPQEFASSVWYEATTFALSLPEGERAGVLDEWLRFAHWGDRLDEIQLGSRPPADRTEIEAELKAAAADFLRGHS